MRAGFCSTDITPQKGVPIGGNIREDSGARGAHDPLMADIIALESAGTRVLLIDTDWVAADLELIRGVKEEVSKQTGIERDNICISMTHTHSGPDIYAMINGSVLAEETKAYVKQEERKISEGAKAAVNDLQDVSIGWSSGEETSISFNRRVLMKDKSLVMNWEFCGQGARGTQDIERFEGSVDPQVNVLKICAEGKLKAVLVNFALHPAVMVGKDLLFSRDFIWGLDTYLKEKYGQDVLVYYTNGTQGDVNHIDIYNKQQARDWSEAERIGRVLGSRAEQILDSIETAPSDDLKISTKMVKLPRRSITAQQLAQAKELWEKCRGDIPCLEDGIPDEWYAKDLISLADEGADFEEVELQVIRIGEAVIYTLPGEVFTEYGLKIRQRSKSKFTVLFGITNQCAGYIPTPQGIKNGGMEGRTCHFSRFAPQAGDIIVDALLDMAENI